MQSHSFPHTPSYIHFHTHTFIHLSHNATSFSCIHTTQFISLVSLSHFPFIPFSFQFQDNWFRLCNWLAKPQVFFLFFKKVTVAIRLCHAWQHALWGVLLRRGTFCLNNSVCHALRHALWGVLLRRVTHCLLPFGLARLVTCLTRRVIPCFRPDDSRNPPFRYLFPPIHHSLFIHQNMA
jgi:hypothetical protein